MNWRQVARLPPLLGSCDDCLAPVPPRPISLHRLVGVAALGLVACAPRERSTGASASPGGALAYAVASATATAEASPVAPTEGTSPDADLAKALRTSDPQLAAWMDQAADLRLEVLVTEVPPGNEAWATYAFRADTEYFYPASAIKPFLAIAALRFGSARAKKPIEPGSRIIRCAHDRPRCEPPPADEDKDAEKGAEAKGDDASDEGSSEPKKIRKKLFLGEEIQKLLSYSDNDSYDRLYDLVGHRELNETMRAIGFLDVRFQHPTEGTPDSRKTTLATRLVRPSGQSIAMKERTSDWTFPPLELAGLGIGAKYQGERGLVDGPMDFSTKNRASIHDLQRVLMSLVHPEHVGSVDLGLTEAQHEMLVSAMTRSPQPGAKVADHYPMAPGVLDSVPPKSLRYIGKAGKAFGFLLESAYIENKDTHRAVFVAATVLANPDGIMNDDVYAYDELARPVLRAVGAAVAKRFLIDRGTP